MELVAQLKRAIDGNDLAGVQTLMTRDPTLHKAPMGYGKNGPLTWVAECRGLSAPTPERLAMAEWMIANGSDVHQGGDGPLMRAALNGVRVPMMESLVRHGADVNALWGGSFPILWAPCETVDPVAMDWLLRHGADPDTPAVAGSALDYLIGTYLRTARLRECVDVLRAAGGTTRYDIPGVMEAVLDRADLLAVLLDDDQGLLARHFPQLDFGSSGTRRLLLQGGTLLHVAAEYGAIGCARVLLDRGAEGNARGGSGQTPLFHAVTGDFGLDVTRLLIERGADLSARATLPGHYERLHEFVECSPLGYALRFPGDEFPGSNARTLELLRDCGAAE